MLGTHKVVAMTFAGRRETMRLLAPIVAKHRGLIDQWLLCWNVRQADDEAYVRSLAEELGPFVKIVPKSRIHSGYHDFYRNCYDRNTIYLKIDDDIVWAEDDAIAKLLAFRAEHPDYSLVSANVINNVRLSHLDQRFGMLGWDKQAGWDPWDAVGLCDGKFAEHVHRRFIASIEAGDISGWKFNLFEMNGHERFSINCIAFFGSDIAQAGGVPEDDELYLTTTFGQRLDKRPVFFGQAVVAHYSFGPQYEHIRTTDVLDRYARLRAH